MKQKTKAVYEYKMNVSGREVCDKCLQPIDFRHFCSSLDQLEEDLIASEGVYKTVLNVRFCGRLFII